MNNNLMTQKQYRQFYGQLSNMMHCTHGKSCKLKHKRCNGTLKHTLDWMKFYKIEHARDNVEKIVDSGGHCDCEVLLNVPPKQWKATRDKELQYPLIFGEQKANEFVSLMLLQSVQLDLWTDNGKEIA